MTSRHTARAIVIHDDNILLIERWRDGLHYFSIPGGGIEQNETAETAIGRELIEETSITVAVERLVFEVHAPDATHFIFLCQYGRGTPALAPDAPERSAGPTNVFVPVWKPLSDFPTLPLIYWEPLRAPLVAAIRDGFPTQPIIVSSATSR